MSSDFYDILGVSPSASQQEIKTAYRKLARKHHPDRNPDDREAAEERFRTIQRAYAILSDKEKRQRYDQYGAAAFEQGGAQGHRFDGSDLFDDLFSNFFGGRASQGSGNRRRSRSMHGEDLQYEIRLTFAEAALGIDAKTIEFSAPVECDPCDGSGKTKDSREVQCSTCGGHGVRLQRAGIMQVQVNCETCKGLGSRLESPCSKCRGDGRVTGKRSVEIKIPAGIEVGDKLRVHGRGAAGAAGGESGDLYVLIGHIGKHDLFVRRGRDLYCELPVSFPDAALGCTKQIKGIDGTQYDVDVPAGSQSGEQIVIDEGGIADLRRRRKGDLKCELFVEVPRRLSDEQRELLVKLRDSEPEPDLLDAIYPTVSKWIKKIGKIFD